MRSARSSAAIPERALSPNLTFPGWDRRTSSCEVDLPFAENGHVGQLCAVSDLPPAPRLPHAHLVRCRDTGTSAGTADASIHRAQWPRGLPTRLRSSSSPPTASSEVVSDASGTADQTEKALKNQRFRAFFLRQPVRSCSMCSSNRDPNFDSDLR
jgi:hypothetical protein